MRLNRTLPLVFTLAIAATTYCPIIHAQGIQVSSANRTIQVTATEDAERRADTALVNLGFILYAPTSAAVNEKASATSKAIAKAVEAAGVPKDALESQSQATGPVQDYQNNQLSPEERAQRKFQTQQSWTARVPAADAAKVLATAVNAGANQSGNIDWSVADENSLTAEAAGKALKHAQAIAEQMAAGLNAKLGALIYASNEAPAPPVRPMMQRMAKSEASAAMNPVERKTLDLNPPMVRRSATVTAVFSLQ